MEFDSEIVLPGKPIVLGILGKLESLSKEELHEKVLEPLLNSLERPPDKVLVPSEGQTSAYISIWSERNHVDTQILEADWRKFQRRAIFLRDARILKEATHLLIFGGLRSTKNEEIACREVQKGKTVFLLDPRTVELCELVVED